MSRPLISYMPDSHSLVFIFVLFLPFKPWTILFIGVLWELLNTVLHIKDSISYINSFYSLFSDFNCATVLDFFIISHFMYLPFHFSYCFYISGCSVLVAFCFSFIFYWSIVDLQCCASFRRRRQWHPTPVLLPGKSHGRRSLVGCSPWGR